jgi:hypothetical protein
MFLHPVEIYPAVVVHGLDHARQAAAIGRPFVMLSAPGAAGYAGCLWWRGLVEAAADESPGLVAGDILDCGAAPGWAMAALRVGQRALVLDPACPAWARVAAAAAGLGAIVLPQAPVALDLGQYGSERKLARWLENGGS